ncbi:serine/threonine protein kinase [Cystobacter ferrugineus]|uniref:Serine/threonine protein kinase n=1 Tax=Cystobacter ferrugineus TaxID=83449 RepID=A0A1L9B9C4_9BACT|nr:serine/threonine protein kinase [Cystobacter ferrugineus]OJT20069.1 serine/threonine protein kinase [Archangium sp. Cb G35]
MAPTCPSFLASVVLLCMCSGCTTPGGVSLRSDGSPGPQECPEEAIKAMRILNLRVGDGAVVDLDVNQALTSPITLYDGPVESMLSESLGPLAPATRLYGRVWTGGPQVVVRYYEAHPPDGEPFPLCAVARLAHGQMQKKPESKPGTAILEFSRAGVFVVNSFR